MTSLLKDPSLAEPEGPAAAAETQMRLFNPADGSPLTDLVFTTDLDEVVAAARAAQTSWGTTTPQQRAAYLLALADALEANADELVRLESVNVGKPIAATREEIPTAADVLRFSAGLARTAPGINAGEYAPGNLCYVRREPIGVVGLIAPWNYPLVEAAYKLGPALAGGNTVILKPSELTPLTTVRLGQLAETILPPGVLNIVHGDGRIGAALVNHPDIALVSLTGDTSTGVKVAEAAAQSLKRVHLELGGKAPVVVCDDVDLDAIIPPLVYAGYENAGQICTAACRVIVSDKIYDQFVEAYVREAKSLVVGNPADETTQIGPVVSERQLDKVISMVDRARAEGAIIECGGERIDRPGYYYAPTVITNVEQDSEIVQREVFGPVVTIQRASDDAEMLKLANDVDYGLAAGVWTSDLARTQYFTSKLDFGTVWVNQHQLALPELPFGGFKRSGYGNELSVESINEYTRLKAVMIKSKP